MVEIAFFTPLNVTRILLCHSEMLHRSESREEILYVQCEKANEYWSEEDRERKSKYVEWNHQHFERRIEGGC